MWARAPDRPRLPPVRPCGRTLADAARRVPRQTRTATTGSPADAGELAHLAATEGVGGWGAVLGPADAQGCGFEIDLQVHHFGRPEAVPTGWKHHCASR